MNISKLFNKPKINPQQRFELRNRHKCLDCKKLVNRKAKRCMNCAVKHRDNSYCKDNLKHYKGSKNPRYVNGGRSYRKLVDLLRCELCSSDINLEVHHKDMDRNNNKKDNLQVLCISCHRKQHPREIKRDEGGRFIR
jgi:hypothetical protein